MAGKPLPSMESIGKVSHCPTKERVPGGEIVSGDCAENFIGTDLRERLLALRTRKSTAIGLSVADGYRGFLCFDPFKQSDVYFLFLSLRCYTYQFL